MNGLLKGFEFICAYIDNLFIFTKSDWEDHVQKLNRPLNKLKKRRLNCDIEKSFFVQIKMEYLGL